MMHRDGSQSLVEENINRGIFATIAVIRDS